MGINILVTGAAGYIGGSVITEFHSATSGPLVEANIIATVRRQSQVETLANAGIQAILLDLHDEKASFDAVIKYEVDMVVNAANGFTPSILPPLIAALGERRKKTGREVFFIQTSVTNLYIDEVGWSFGQVQDSDDVYHMEKKMEAAGNRNPIVAANLATIDEAKKHNVKSVVLPVPLVYGRGSGVGRVLSVNIPAYVRSGSKHRMVNKMDQNGITSAVHIDDLTSLYAIIATKLLLHQPIATDEKGYYFTIAHKLPTWSMMDGLAAAMHSRGLVDKPKAEVWSNEQAAKEWGYPVQHVRAMSGAMRDECVPVQAKHLGWEPKWDTTAFLAKLDGEVEDVLTLDTVAPTIFNQYLDAEKE